MTDIEERAQIQSNGDTKHFVLSMTEGNASKYTRNILTSSKKNEEPKIEEMLSDIILDKTNSGGFFGDLHSSKKEINTMPKIITDGFNSNVNIDNSTMIEKRLNTHVEKIINADKADSLNHSDNYLECSKSLTRTQKTKGDINEVSEMISTNNDSQQIISTEIEERNDKIYAKEASNISDPLNKTEEMICFNDTNFTTSVTPTENINMLQENTETELNNIMGKPILEDCNGTETHVQSTNNIQSSQSLSKNTEKIKFPVISSQTETFTSMGKDDISVNLVVPSKNVNSKDQTSDDKFKSDDPSTENEKNEMDTNVMLPIQVHFDIMGKSFEEKGSLSTTDSNKGEKTSLSLTIVKEGKDNESQSIEHTCADINEPTIENLTCSHQTDILACSDIKYFSQPCFPTFQQNFKEGEESEVSSTENSQEIVSVNQFNEDIPFLMEFLATGNKSEERYNGGKDNENSSHDEKQSISENDEENSKSVQLYNKNVTSAITSTKHINTGKQYSCLPSEICRDITNSKEDFNQYLLESQGIGIQETPQSPDPFVEKGHGSNMNTETPYDKEDSNLSTKESSQEIISNYEINKVGDLTGEIIDEQIITENENKYSCNREDKRCTSTNTANECSKLIELYNKNSISDIKHNQNIYTEIQHSELLPETFKNTNSNDDSHEILSEQEIIQIDQKLPESPVLFMRNIHEINDVIKNSLAQENYRNNDKEGNHAHMLQHNSNTGHSLPSKRTEGLIIGDAEYILHKNSNIEAIVDQHGDSGKGFQETAQRDITKLSTEQIKDRNEPTGNLNLSGMSYEHYHMQNLQFSLSIPIQDLGNRCENKESDKENKNKNDAETEITKAGKQNCCRVLEYTYGSSKKEKHMSTLGDVNKSYEKDYEIMKSNNGHVYESELELVHKPDMTGQNATLLADVSAKAVCNNYDNTEGTDKEKSEETIKGSEEYYVAEMQHVLSKPNIQVITSKYLNIETWRENNRSVVNTDNRFEKYDGKDSKNYLNDNEAPDRLNTFPRSDEINQFPSTEVTYKSCTMKKIFSPELNKESTETSDKDCISKTIPLQDSSINNNWELKNAVEERQQPSIVEALNRTDNDQLIHESISPNPANLLKENEKLLSTQENNYFHKVNKTNFTENTKLSSPRNDTTYNKQIKKIGNLNLFKRIASSNLREFDPALNEHAILTNSCDEDYSEMSRITYPQDINCHKNYTLTYMQYEDKQFNEDKIKESVDELFGSDNSFESWSDLENALQTNHTIVDNILDFEIETAMKKYETNDSDQATVDQTNPAQSTTVQTDITGEVYICKHNICNNKQCTCATHCKLTTKRSIEALCLETISTNKKAKFDIMRLNNNYEQYDSDFCTKKISEKEKQTIYFLEEEEEEREDSGEEETEEEEEDEESNGTVPSSANENCFVNSDQKVPDADVDNSWMRGDLNQNEMYTNDQLITGTSKNEHLFRWNSPAYCTFSSQGINLPRKCPLRVGLSKRARPTSLHQSRFTR